jgi:hypothetical protein
MKFFFIRDYEQKYRYFSSDPLSQIQIKSSRWKDMWEKAKKKLMLLPQRSLRQEQAFARVLKMGERKIQVFHSGRHDEKKTRNKFFFFLHKQRTRHVLLLSVEALLLPLSGLAALLPGPNVFFGVLALLMMTHWQALRGINQTLKKDFEFIPSALFSDWELAVEEKKEEGVLQILSRIEKEFNLDSLHKVLYK